MVVRTYPRTVCHMGAWSRGNPGRQPTSSYEWLKIMSSPQWVTTALLVLLVSGGKCYRMLSFTVHVVIATDDHWWPLTIDTGLAQVVFITQPQNATVVEGGDATFQCAVEENGTAV